MPIGPGRYSAMTAETSSKLSGRICRSSERIGPPSSWNTPSVSPRPSSSYVGGSSSGTSSMRMGGLPFITMFSSASSRIVRLRRPRKSILISPSDSEAGWSNCVMMAPSCGRFMIGMMSSSGSLDMMTPAACTPHWRLRFSRPRAVSSTRWASGSAATTCRNSSASA